MKRDGCPMRKKRGKDGKCYPFMKSEAAFIEYHKTGYIEDSAYKRTEQDMSYCSLKRHPVLYKKIMLNGEIIELRKTGEKLSYVKTDAEGEIMRDSAGTALNLSDDEIRAKGLKEHDTGIVAFNQQGVCVGHANDEFGATGVFVLKPYQKKGLGLMLLQEYRSQYPIERRLGQMTFAGEQLARSWYRSMEPGNRIILKPKDKVQNLFGIKKKYDTKTHEFIE